jgi:hypothetical protein
VRVSLETQPKLEYGFVQSKWRCAIIAWVGLVCLLGWHSWASAEPLHIFNVDVYLTEDPNCQLANINPPLRATISPFQDSVMLADVVTELARMAAQTGATVVHSIRLLSVIPSQGAQVTAIAGTCLNNSLNPFNAKLAKTLYAATNARQFSFPQSGSFGPSRTILSTEKTPGETITEQMFEQLRTQIVASVRSGGGPVKTCPFEPTTGFQFLAGDEEAWWLVSQFCRTGMLVSPTDAWNRVPVVNLTPEAVANFESIGVQKK